MRKRLRKKKHVGEYTEWGRQFIITRNRRDGFDEFLDAFIEEAIEANGCFCGGGGKEDKLDVVVELGKNLTDADYKKNQIVKWVESRSDVKGLTYSISTFTLSPDTRVTGRTVSRRSSWPQPA